MSGLVEVGLSLSRELSLDDLLARIVQAAREVVGARYAALGVLSADARSWSSSSPPGWTTRSARRSASCRAGAGCSGR